MARFSSILISLLGSIYVSNAHLVMKSPIPFNNGSLESSPLRNAAVGSAASDFPCKQGPHVYRIVRMNHMTVGEVQTLSFSGTVSHGGGTCQVAVSLDLEPTASSIWKIIQVYQGGCPIVADGNDGTKEFQYKIPAAIPNGRATLAWLWYSRWGGSPEVFMNCAPISVSGGARDTEKYNTLPNMYVINLPSSECATQDGKNQIIPVPGDSIVKDDERNEHVSAIGTGCVQAAAAQTLGMGVRSRSGDSQSGSSMATKDNMPIPTETVAAVSTQESQSFDQCDSDGLFCNGPTRYGLCNKGMVTWQTVARGTRCVDGRILHDDTSIPT